MSQVAVYQELLRPGFHFTAKKNWLNDPNGLVYYKGEYHLFFQYNAKGLKWGPNSWGHAVSGDLLHWEQLADALDPDEEFGWIWSGSAVVDWGNTSGLRKGEGEEVLVAMYTTGNTHTRPWKPVVQGIAYSNDRGRTWEKYGGNPVMGNIVNENRDPKVVWHEGTRAWVMVLYLDKDVFAIFKSPDLKKWTRLQDVVMAGTSECPDFFEMAVAGTGEKKWVFWGGSGVYLIGSFDGKRFEVESELLRSELGANGYAAQSWSDVPAGDGRRIQISWMRGGKYPYMPFNQQMSFPVELELRRFGEGLRLCRRPIREIEALRERTMTWQDRVVEGGKNWAPEVEGDLFHIHMVIEAGGVEGVGIAVHGTDLRYLPGRGVLTYLGTEVAVGAVEGKLELELLVDRTSLEIFGQGGKVSASFCFLPEATDYPVEIYVVGARAKISSLTVHSLRSIWR